MTTDFTTLTLDEAQKLGREPLTEEDCERMVDDHYREVEMHKPIVVYEDKLDGGSVTSSGPVLSITATAFPFGRPARSTM